MNTFRLSVLFIVISSGCPAQNWQTLGTGLSWYTTCMYNDTFSDQLFVGGAFGQADSQVVRFAATYNNTWNPLGIGFNVCSWGSGLGNPWAIARYGSHVYFGGNFDCAGSIDGTQSFARWDGTNWDSVPGGKIPFNSGVIRDMIVYNNELYVCGTFDSIGNLPAKGIAKWDGTTWSVIGSNYNFVAQGFPLKLAVYHGNLYVGGSFFDPQNNLCRLAKWDGSSWEFFSTLGNFNLAVWDMEVYNDELYVGGEFYYGGGNPGTGIMRWNDTT